MKTMLLVATVLTVLLLWVEQGESKALNEWNDNYPNDFFDPYDPIPPKKHHKKKGNKEDGGPFYRPVYDDTDNKVSPNQVFHDNEVQGGYYEQWDNQVGQEQAEWDAKIKDKWMMPKPGQKASQVEWGSGNDGFASDDEDDRAFEFEQNMLDQDEKRQERLQYELEDVDFEREHIMKRLNRVQDRLTEEKQIIKKLGKRHRKF